MSLKLRAKVSFPSSVQSTGPISITKANGIWSINYAPILLSYKVPAVGDLPTDYLVVWDSISNTCVNASISSIVALSASPAQTVDSAAGDYSVTTETMLLVNKTVPAANNVVLPTSLSRSGVPLIVKDLAGNAATYAITIKAFGTEKIDGASQYQIVANYGAVKLVPLSSGWFVSY